MNSAAADAPERFRSWIAQCLGLQFDDSKLGFLADVLARRVDRTKETLAPYLDALRGPRAHEELRILAPELTVAETYFFRHIEQLRAFVEVALPDCLTRAGARTLRVLSAGCASGEEPYSLAILVREHFTDAAPRVRILGVDVNPVMIEKAVQARYLPWSLRQMPPDLRQRWFRSEGREAILDDSIRSAVTFSERNLAEDDSELWMPHAYDVIFCRNVLMYFTFEQAQALVARLTRSLVPGGYLFLGHAETLRGLSNDFSLCHTRDTFYYQRKLPFDQRDAVQDLKIERPLPTAASGPDPAAASAEQSWLEAVQSASQRIKALTTRSARPGRAQSGPGSAGRPGVTGLPLALELLKKERFAEALNAIGPPPDESVHDPDVALLQAALLTHSGRLDAAERACAALLRRDELNAGGHYLLALCREAAGDRRGALEHDQAAMYLDPSFAMPRLHLGLMARRAGDLHAAQRELGQALLLLQREEASRLLLFGGGFGRDALLSLCRAELAVAGGQS
jgi:chemotaxis protein methyltransferase CheR